MQKHYAERECWIARHLPACTPEPGTVAFFEEPMGHGLNNLFVLQLEGVNYLGRKLLDETGALGSLLSPRMLLGPLLKARHTHHCLRLHYTALSLEEKHRVFVQASCSPDATVHFPFPVLDEHGNEQVAPLSFWDDTRRLARHLDPQETHFRQHCLGLLSKRLAPGAVVYDPACSTGTFIASLAAGLPHVQCLGSDISAAMIDHARVQHVHPNLRFALTDAVTPAIAPGRCDVLVLRFLNAEVMRQHEAVHLFERLVPLVRYGGLVIVFGHTPVLIPMKAEARRLGLNMTGALARCPHTQALFQLFTLERS